MLGTVIASSLHFALVILVSGLLAAELALVRPGADRSALRLTARIDALYGLSFLALAAIGIARVAQYEKGWEFYRGSEFFWAKMTLLLVIALCSLKPTLRFIAWSRRTRADAAFRPSDAEIAGIRLWLWAQAGLLALVPFAAALMARGY
jgi:putative membrane protein